MESEELVMGLAGDVMIGRSVDPVIAKKGYSYVWGDVLTLLQRNDVNIINLETTLTKSEKKVPKVFNFRAAPDKVQSLLDARVTIANLANNHILDYGEEGLAETLQVLREAGIAFAGAGMNSGEAARAYVIRRKNFRLGVLGFTDNEPGWKAGLKNCGVNFIDVYEESDRRRALQDIARLRSESDLVLVSIHWGPNMQEEPPVEYIDFAHAMVDAGADIIHGHSAHIFQGIEVYRCKLILYDTGDFVDDYVVDPVLKNNHSFLFLVRAGRNGIDKLSLVPVLISNYQVNLAAGKDHQWCINRVKSLSARFATTINDDGEVVMRSEDALV